MLLLDGPMGTQLMKAHGLLPGEVLAATLKTPQWVSEVHQAYLQAGARWLLTNTFALPFQLDDSSDSLLGRALDCAWQSLSVLPPSERNAVRIDVNLGPAEASVFATTQFQRVLTTAMSAVKAGRAHGLFFETLGVADLEWLLPIVSTLAANDVSFSASFRVGRDVGGVEENTLSSTLHALPGAYALGLNCFSLDDTAASTLDLFSRLTLGKDTRRTLKPAIAGEIDYARSEMLFGALELSKDALGLCCGGSPEALRTLGREVERRSV